MIGNLAMLVVSYGISHRLFDFAWKGQLRCVYPSAHEYQVGRPGFVTACVHLHTHGCACLLFTGKAGGMLQLLCNMQEATQLQLLISCRRLARCQAASVTCYRSANSASCSVWLLPGQWPC